MVPAPLPRELPTHTDILRYYLTEVGYQITNKIYTCGNVLNTQLKNMGRTLFVNMRCMTQRNQKGKTRQENLKMPATRSAHHSLLWRAVCGGQNCVWYPDNVLNRIGVGFHEIGVTGELQKSRWTVGAYAAYVAASGHERVRSVR